MWQKIEGVSVSLLIVVFYCFAVPFLIFNIVFWLLKREKKLFRKGLVVITAIGLFSWYLWEAVEENWWLDR
jgi:hypothetical protein